MNPTKPRFGFVERTASNVLSEFGISSAPVPVEEIIKSRGIEYRRPNLGEDVSGVLVRTEGRMIIGVNHKQTVARQRFTAAHELGHALLHDGESVHQDREFRVNLRSPRSSLGVDPIEVEANHFAACLLMPAVFVEADPDAFFVDVENAAAVAAIAKRYGVSSHAMALRLAALAARSKR